MTTMHIQLDEAIAQALEEKALRAGKATEQLAAEMLSAQVSGAGNGKPSTKGPEDRAFIEKIVESARNSGGDSRGWKWNRDELYDR